MKTDEVIFSPLHPSSLPQKPPTREIVNFLSHSLQIETPMHTFKYCHFTIIKRLDFTSYNFDNFLASGPMLTQLGVNE